MNQGKKPSAEEGGEEQNREHKFTIRNIFYHNTFLMIFSFLSAVVIWFIMAAGNEEKPYIIYDVPIEVKFSAAAEEAGLQVFNCTYSAADISVSGNSMIISKLGKEDFSVTATLNPTSTKIVGNTLQKLTVPVRVEKKSSVSDYNIESVDPVEITLEYDRYKEAVFPIENNVKYSADSGYYAGTASLSADTVTISGPESAVNKISRVAAEYTVDEVLKGDKVISACSLTLYDQSNQKITDYSGMYLSMSTETVEITIPVMSRKTVAVVPNLINTPKSFAAARVTVEPAQIEVAGPADVLSGLDEIVLSDTVDFSQLSPSKKNEFEMEIPIPAGVRDITNLGTGVSMAKVTVNLNGYQEAKFSTENITLKTPAGMDAELTTKLLEVSVVGSEAQISKLTGDSISCTADLTNFAEQTGTVEVPVTVTVSGADSCWAVGSSTVYVTILDRTTLAAARTRDTAKGVAATPQE